jgi:hypothetical protein
MIERNKFSTITELDNDETTKKCFVIDQLTNGRKTFHIRSRPKLVKYGSRVTTHPVHKYTSAFDILDGWFYMNGHSRLL